MSGPVGADRPQQAAQEARVISSPPGRLAGRSTAVDEPPVAVEHDDRLEAVFVVMGVEQPQLLAAMHGVEGVVDVEHDPLGNLRERTRNKDRPWRGPCAAARARSGRFSSREIGRLRSTVRGPTAARPAPS